MDLKVPVSPGPILGAPMDLVVDQNFFCGNYTKGPIEYAFVGVSSFLYLMLLVVAIVVSVQGCRRVCKGGLDLRLHHPTVERGQKLRLAISILLVFQMISRIVSSVFNLFSGDEMYIIWWATSRVANVCGVVAFTLVGTLWLSIGHHARDPPKMNQRTFDRFNIIGAALFGLALAVYAVVTVAVAPISGPGALIFEIHVIVVSVIQLLMMVFFTIYGLVLYLLVRRAGEFAGHNADNKPAPTHTGSIARVGAMYSFLFLMKSITFSYRILTQGCLLPHWFFWTLAYYLPELVAQGHLLWSYFRINRKRDREKQEYRRLARGRAAAQHPSTPSTASLHSSTASDVLPHMLEGGQDSSIYDTTEDSLSATEEEFGSGNLGEAAFEYATSPNDGDPPISIIEQRQRQRRRSSWQFVRDDASSDDSSEIETNKQRFATFS